MSSARSVESTRYDTRLPWGDILLASIAAVSWALIGMAGTAALGLHLLEADTAGSLGPMTAAVVALGAGGSVSPSGDVSAFGLEGAEATTAIVITPLGVSLVGALLLSWFFLRSLRGAGVVISRSELLARAGAVVALFVAMLGGLAWAGHDVITFDGSSLGLDDLPGTGGSGSGLEIPGLGDIGDIGGLLPDQVGDLIDAKAAVGFTVDTVPTLLGGLGWSAGILLIALLASRRTPLPRGWEAVHRVVRPAVSALVTVLLVAVAAGFAAAGYAAISDDHPKRIAGAALLGAPNGVWLGIPIGLFVPWDGRASGPLATLLPDPLDNLLSSEKDQSVSLSRLAELDGRVWLLGVAAALMMLLAGVLMAARTPLVRGVPGVRDPGALGFAGQCALRLGIATALALPLLAWLTEVSVNASLSVLGFPAFGAGIELRGDLGIALLLGALWGAAVGAAGALLAYASGAAGRRAAPLARGDVGAGAQGAAYPRHTVWSGPYAPVEPYRPPNSATNPYLRVPDELLRPDGRQGPEDARPSGRGTPSGAGRPPDAAPPTGGGRPYEEAPPTGGGRPYSYDETPASDPARGSGDASPGESPSGADVYGAPTRARPMGPPPRWPYRPRRARKDGEPPSSDERPPPPAPPPPPPPPPGRPKGQR